MRKNAHSIVIKSVAVLLSGLALLLCAATASQRDHSLFTLLRSVERPDGTIDNDKLYSQLNVKTSLFQEPPKGDLFTLFTGTNSWKMLRLSDAWLSKWQYLLFQQNTDADWRFVANIDFPDEHYEAPAHKLHDMKGKKWLEVVHIASYGTGVLSRESAWYSLDSPFTDCKLRYLHDGHFVDQNGVIQEYVLLNQECTVTGENPVVSLRHRIISQKTDVNGAEKVISQKEIDTQFVWSNEKSRFEISGPIMDPKIVAEPEK